MAIAFYGLAVVFAPPSGRTLGGWITDNYSWHWIFLINVPIGMGLSSSRRGRHGRGAAPSGRGARQRWARGVNSTMAGFGFLISASGSLEVMLDRGQEDDWFAEQRPSRRRAHRLGAGHHRLRRLGASISADPLTRPQAAEEPQLRLGQR